jgi:hypothetical protein
LPLYLSSGVSCDGDAVLLAPLRAAGFSLLCLARLLPPPSRPLSASAHGGGEPGGEPAVELNVPRTFRKAAVEAELAAGAARFVGRRGSSFSATVRSLRQVGRYRSR